VGQHTYGKEEKLKIRILINKIFSDGEVVKAYPIRIQYIVHNLPGYNSLEVGVSVSKRLLKKAVDRNRIKRVLRECYRLNKDSINFSVDAINSVTQLGSKKLAMMIIYSKSEELPFVEIEKQVKSALTKIVIAG